MSSFPTSNETFAIAAAASANVASLAANTAVKGAEYISTNVQFVANSANAAVAAANTATIAANNAIVASNTAVYAANTAVGAANTAVIAANTAVDASLYAANTVLTISTLANTVTIAANNAIVASNTAVYAANTTLVAANSVSTNTARTNLLSLLAAGFSSYSSLTAFTDSSLQIGDKTVVAGDARYSVTSLSPLTWTKDFDTDGKIASASVTAATTLAASINPFQLLDIEKSLSLTNVPSFRTSPNRLKRIGQCNWVKCATNEPRIYVDNSGAVAGVIFDGSETIKSADYFTAPTSNTSPQWITVTGTGATVSQVGSHAFPDIAGGTGKLVTGVAGSVSTQFRANNLAQSVVNGDVLRVAALVVFPITGSSYQPRLGTFNVSGTSNTNQCVITVSAAGVPTVVPNTALRAGIDLFDTDALGNNWYRVWMDIAVTATASLAPVLIAPQNVAGTYQFMLWSVKNPTQTVPSAVPVMADASFIADSIVVSSTTPLEVEWTELCVGKTSISDGNLTPPRFASAPPLAIEKRITVKAASELTGISYVLPGPRQALLFPNSGAVDLKLGPGFWNASVSINTATSYSLVGAYSDPKKWPILRRARFFSTSLTSLTLDKIAFWLRTPVGTSTNLTDFTLSIEIDAAKCTLGDIFVAGAEADWSQSYTYPEGGRNYPYTRARFGRVQFTPSVGGTYSFGKMKVVRSGGGVAIIAPANVDVGINGTGLAVDQISMDGLFIGPSANSTGTIGVTLGHDARGDIEGISEAFWQSAYEIEVDIGSGWQTLSAAGITATNLPKWKKFYNYGTHTNGVITVSPKPEQILYVSAYGYVSTAGAVSKPGYQYNLSNVVASDPTTGEFSYYSIYPGDGTVWVSDSTNSPSPSDPRIRVRHQSSKWTNSTTVVTNNGIPLQVGAGVHGDHFQASNLKFNYTYNCQNVLMLGTGGQGYFQNTGANTLATSFNARGIFSLEYGNGVCIQSANATISGILTRKESRLRTLYATNSPDISKIVTTAGTVIDASNFYVATVSTETTGKAGAGTVTGPIPYAIARITNNTTVTPASVDQPSVAIRNEHFFPPEMLENGQLASWVNPGNIKVTGFASEKLGFDFNSIIKTCQDGAWGYFKDLETICSLDSPTHYTSVTNATVANTSLTLTPITTYTATLRGKTIVQGDPRKLFKIENGVLKVNAALNDMYGVPLVDNAALVTDANERISVKITA